MGSGVDLVLNGIPIEVIDPGIVEVLRPVIGWSIFGSCVRDNRLWRKTSVLKFAFEAIYFRGWNVDFEGDDLVRGHDYDWEG